MAKPQYSEDLNREGFYWSFVIQRADVNTGNEGKAIIISKCPFIQNVRAYIEDVVASAINMLIDEHNVRNFSKLKAIIKQVYWDLNTQERVPVAKDIDILGDADGLRAFINLGQGYAVDFRWTEYNEYWETQLKWFKTSGKHKLRKLVDKYLHAEW